MPLFNIGCTWKVAHDFVVEADTLEQAIEKVEDGDGDFSLKGGDYIDDSFQVQKDACFQFQG